MSPCSASLPDFPVVEQPDHPRRAPAGSPRPTARAKRSDATKRSSRWRIAFSAPASIAGASTSARAGRTSRASASKSIGARDLRVELVGHRLLHGRAAGDRRHRVHVAVGVQHARARPDRDQRRGRRARSPARAGTRASPRRSRERRAPPGGPASRSSRAGARPRSRSCAASSGGTASAMPSASAAPGVARDHPRRVIRRHPPGAQARPMSNLVAIAYPDVDTARTVAEELAAAHQGAVDRLDDMVVVERARRARSSCTSRAARPARGAAGGALLGHA